MNGYEHDNNVGVFEQIDKTKTAVYDRKYFQKYLKYTGQKISLKINEGRKNIVDKYLKDKKVIDIGIGSGEFILKRGVNTYGYDINDIAKKWLVERKLYIDIGKSTEEDIDGYTFWDSLEHISDWEKLIKDQHDGFYIFISIPIFEYFHEIEKNKHFRPNEHYYYYTKEGLIKALKKYNYVLIETQSFEIAAGRDSILTFAFKKINDKYQKIYQRLYNYNNTYGRAKNNHCPGIRLYDYYKDYLKSPIIDLGCGTGETVQYVRDHGYKAEGIDFVKMDNNMLSGDITQPLKLNNYKTALCMDVFEHLTNDGIKGLLKNLFQVENQIFSICNIYSVIEIDGEEVDLHINKKPFETWEGILTDYFEIKKKFSIRDYQMLYITERKKSLI